MFNAGEEKNTSQFKVQGMLYFSDFRHECEQTLGDSEGQGSLACCSPWDRQESDTTEQLNKSALRTVKEMRLGTCGIRGKVRAGSGVWGMTSTYVIAAPRRVDQAELGSSRTEHHA